MPGATVTVTAVGDERVPDVGHRCGRRLRRSGPRAGPLSRARRAERIPAADARRDSARHRRDRAARPAAGGRRRDRGGHRHGRRAARCAARHRDSGRSSTTGRSSTCRSTAAASSRWPRSCPAWRCRRARRCPRINGGRPRTNEYLFDGISVLQPEPGQVAFFPNVDAIQEFKIESNSPPAEFGRFNGGVVNLTTKSGSNALRGSAFEFFRHEALNARNFFASTDPVKPTFRRNQFGGVLGGPIRAGSHVLLRRLPGPAADDRAHGDLDGADAAAAAGHLHRGDRRPRAGHLRSGDDGTGCDAHARFPATRFQSSGWIRSRVRCWSAIRCRPAPARPTTTGAWTTRRSIRISSASGSTIDLPGNRDQVFGRLTRFREEFVPVTPLPDGSGVTTRHARAAGHDLVVVRLELSAHVLRSPAERAARRRHAAHRRPQRRAT